MLKTVRPRHNWVLCKAVPQEKTASGLILSEKVTSLPPSVFIMELGGDVKDLEVGEEVAIQEQASIRAIVGLPREGSEEFFLVRDGDIVAVMVRD